MPQMPFLGYDWIGFDMDHAIVRYEVEFLHRLIFTSLVNSIADRIDADSTSDNSSTNRYIDSGKLRAAEFDPAHGAKGLFLDLTTGDLLKVDDRGHVCAARHGAGPCSWLSKGAIRERYGGRPWRFYDHVERGERSPSYFVFTTSFELPAAQICSILVDMRDDAKAPFSTPLVYDFMPHLLAGFNHIFLPEALALGRGGYFNELVNDTARYVRRRPKLRCWLQRLRERGVRLFLLTNSHVNYSELLMRHAFGQDWRSLFDLIIFHAGKGHGFFKAGSVDHRGVVSSSFRPFYCAAESPSPDDSSFLSEAMNAKGPQVKPSALKLGRSYTEGNFTDLANFFGNSATVCYFGDHLRSDIELISTVTAEADSKTWATIGVVEEVSADEPIVEGWGAYVEGGGEGVRGTRPSLSFWGGILARHVALTVADIVDVAEWPLSARPKSHGPCRIVTSPSSTETPEGLKDARRRSIIRFVGIVATAFAVFTLWRRHRR